MPEPAPVTTATVPANWFVPLFIGALRCSSPGSVRAKRSPARAGAPETSRRDLGVW
jgi:hypothetical protein